MGCKDEDGIVIDSYFTSSEAWPSWKLSPWLGLGEIITLAHIPPHFDFINIPTTGLAETKHGVVLQHSNIYSAILIKVPSSNLCF